MLEPYRVAIGWRNVVKRTVSDAMDDDVLGLAAQLAYYFFLALFPALLFLVAVASFFPLKDLMNQILDALNRFAPTEVLNIVKAQMKQIALNKNGGLLTIGFLATIWSASSAVSATMSALNAAYDIAESRPYWKAKLTAIGLTIAGGIFVLLSFALVVVGPKMAGPFANWVGLGHAFAVFWQIIQWPIVFVLIVIAMGFMYYFGPDAEQRWEWITPGSLLATILWIVSSLGFRFYVTNFQNYNATYGAIGAVIVAMLWFYITGIAILIGAEINAVIEHAAPWGKNPGEKKPGEKRKLGRLAAEAYEREHANRPPEPIAGTGAPSPSTRPVPAQPVPALAPVLASPPRRRASDRVRLSDWIVGGAALVAELALVARSTVKRIRG